MLVGSSAFALAFAACPAGASPSATNLIFVGSFECVVHHLAFAVQPGTTAVDVAIMPGVVVDVTDDCDQPLGNQDVQISIGTNPTGSAALFGALSQSSDATGAASFGDLSVDYAGSGYSLSASVAAPIGNYTTISAAFDVTGVSSCSRQACDALLVCEPVNESTCAIPYCALAGQGNTPGPDPNFAACHSEAAWQDSDGDGFSDAAEAQGYLDNNCNGVYDPGIDVPLPGADPVVPDVYLHYDYVDAGSHDHKPPQAAADLVVEAFAAHGVHLHIDPVHHAIPEAAAKVVTLLATAPDYVPDPACAGPSAQSMHQLRESYPDVELLKPAYHYVVFGHYSSCDTAVDCAVCAQDPECGGGSPPPFAAGGSAEINGNDLIVSLGFFTDFAMPINDEIWAGVLMHELGHNLGLEHGGSDCDNYKPNYLSVMNYAFYTTGIGVGAAPGDSAGKSCALDADCGPAPTCPGPDCESPAHCSATTHQCYRVDYSSFAYNNLPENSLDETIGLSGRPASRDITSWSTEGSNTLNGPTNGAPIDWNHDLSYGIGVNQDINGDGSATLLQSSNDWERADGAFTHLNFSFQCTSNFVN
jgi:hypothetical protein